MSSAAPATAAAPRRLRTTPEGYGPGLRRLRHLGNVQPASLRHVRIGPPAGEALFDHACLMGEAQRSESQRRAVRVLTDPKHCHLLPSRPADRNPHESAAGSLEEGKSVTRRPDEGRMVGMHNCDGAVGSGFPQGHEHA
jgi:hypothetical protein